MPLLGSSLVFVLLLDSHCCVDKTLFSYGAEDSRCNIQQCLLNESWTTESLAFLPSLAQCVEIVQVSVHNFLCLPGEPLQSTQGPGPARKNASTVPSASILSVMEFRVSAEPSAKRTLLSLLATPAQHLILHLPHEFFLLHLQDSNGNIQRNVFHISSPSASLPWKISHLAYLCITCGQCQQYRPIERTRLPWLRKYRADPCSLKTM